MSGCHPHEDEEFQNVSPIMGMIQKVEAQCNEALELIKKNWELNYGADENLSKRLCHLENFGSSPMVASLRALEKMIKEIESKSIDVQVLHTTRQTIETWQKGCEVLISDLQSRVKDIEYRLGHIVELPTELDIRLQDVERKLDGLGNSFVKLRKEFESKLDVDYKKWVQYFSEVHPKKTPHKCPVCFGRGFREDQSLKQHDCNACEGKGIVWG